MAASRARSKVRGFRLLRTYLGSPLVRHPPTSHASSPCRCRLLPHTGLHAREPLRTGPQGPPSCHAAKSRAPMAAQPGPCLKGVLLHPASGGAHDATVPRTPCERRTPSSCARYRSPKTDPAHLAPAGTRQSCLSLIGQRGGKPHTRCKQPVSSIRPVSPLLHGATAAYGTLLRSAYTASPVYSSGRNSQRPTGTGT